MSQDILIVEDEDDIRDMISGILEDEGYDVRQVSTSDAGLLEVKSRTPSLVILDVWLKGSTMDGIEFLDHLKGSNPDLPVIIISGHGSVETAVAAIRKGAYDFIEKPFKADRLILTASRALENAKLRQENIELKGKVTSSDRLIGTSNHVTQIRQKIDRIAPTNSRVLISGPSGSGKELIARIIHSKSHRNEGPFKAVNAASMVPERVEVELFGVEHSGDVVKTGLLEQVTSTSQSLETAVSRGSFREDLYHRLNVMPLQASPLTQRREDIPELVEYFISKLAASTGLPARRIGADAMAALQAHDWPGNVRQLRNNVERLLILATGDPTQEITLDTLPPEVSVVRSGNSAPRDEKMIALPLRDAREHFEREYLQAQIQRFGGNISRTANFVGMERSALHRKLKSLGVEIAELDALAMA